MRNTGSGAGKVSGRRFGHNPFSRFQVMSYNCSNSIASDGWAHFMLSAARRDRAARARKPGLQRAGQSAPVAKPGRTSIRIAHQFPVNHLTMLIQHQPQHHAHTAAIREVVFGRWL
jgi:hypothetical protein